MHTYLSHTLSVDANDLRNILTTSSLPCIVVIVGRGFLSFDTEFSLDPEVSEPKGRMKGGANISVNPLG
jgi:hypothetical protein